MNLRLVARGPASKYEIWAGYVDPQRWPEWSPHLRRVWASGPLRPGLEGEIEGPLGVRASFDVLEVDRPGGRWSWTVRLGPVRLRVDHEVEEGSASLTLMGSPPAVLAYAPLARRALRRLVARRAARGPG